MPAAQTLELTTDDDGIIGWFDADGDIYTLAEAMDRSDPDCWSDMYAAHQQMVADMSAHRDLAYERSFQGEVDHLSDLAIVDGGDRIGSCLGCLADPDRHAPSLDATVAELVSELTEVHVRFDVTATVRRHLG